MAASALTPENLTDINRATLSAYKKLKWVDISLDRQFHIVADRVMPEATEQGGTQCEFSVQHTNTGSFQDSEMYGVVNPAVKDLNIHATVPWSKQQVHYAYDIDEPMFQRGHHATVEVLETRIHSAYNDWFEAMETRFWTSPTSSTQNPVKPYGVPFWVQQSATAAFGFNGGNPSGFSSGAGNISSSTYTNWANGTFTWNAISDDDALDSWSEACDKCYFMAPRDFQQLDSGKSQFEFFTTHTNLQVLRRMLKASNDDIGIDVGKYRGTVLFKGNPVHWVPALSNSGDPAVDSNNPIYGIDWSTIKMNMLEGRNKHWLPEYNAPHQPTTRIVPMINWCQIVCMNRRRNFVGRAA